MYVFKQMLTFSVFLKSISRIKRHNIFHIDKASVYIYVYVYIYIYIYIYIYMKRGYINRLLISIKKLGISS